MSDKESYMGGVRSEEARAGRYLSMAVLASIAFLHVDSSL